MQEERRFVEQPLGRFNTLDHDAARHGVQPSIFLGAQFASGKDNNWHFRKCFIRAQFFQHFETGHVRQPQVEHDAVGRLTP